MRRCIQLLVVLVLATALLGGCGESSTPDEPAGDATEAQTPGTSDQSGAASTGTIRVLVTDAPPGHEITGVEVTVTEVQIHKADADQEQDRDGEGKADETPSTPDDGAVEESDAIVEEDSDGDDGGEWMPLTILEGKETFDLLAIQDLEEVLAVDEVEAGRYTQIRMAVDAVVVYYKEDGSSETRTTEAKLPSGKLKFVRPFDIKEGMTTSLLFDFIAEKSVVFTGSDKVIFKPVIKLTVSEPEPISEDTVQTPADDETAIPSQESPEPTDSPAGETPEPGEPTPATPGASETPATGGVQQQQQQPVTPPAGARGTVAILVTDAPPGYEITSVEVTVDRVEIHRAVAEEEQEQNQEQDQDQEQNQQEEEQQQEQAGDTSGNGKGNQDKNDKSKGTGNSSDEATPAPDSGDTPADESDAVVEEDPDDGAGWMQLGVLAGQETFDLLLIQDLEEVLAMGEVEAGKYTQIRMYIHSVVVEYVDESGTKTAAATVPSGTIKFVRPFNVEAGMTTSLLFDFIADDSLVFTGSGKINFKPVIKLTVSEPQPTPGPTLDITTSALPDGSEGVSYGASLEATGGTEAYVWSVASGTLPAGLSLSGAGMISGTPTAAGDHSFTVQVDDANGRTDTQELGIRIAAVAGPLQIITDSLPSGEEGAPYAYSLGATGGTEPYAWSVASGALPAGLDLDQSGLISGTPTAAGDHGFTVKVDDDAGLSDTRELSIHIEAVVSVLEITTDTLPDGVQGILYSQDLEATGGTLPYVWSVASGTPPAGLSLSGAGMISGTPTAAGDYGFTVQVDDADGRSDTKELGIRIDPVASDP